MIYSIATSEERWKLVKSESFFVVARSRSIFCLVGVPTLGSIGQSCIPYYTLLSPSTKSGFGNRSNIHRCFDGFNLYRSFCSHSFGIVSSRLGWTRTWTFYEYLWIAMAQWRVSFEKTWGWPNVSPYHPWLPNSYFRRNLDDNSWLGWKRNLKSGYVGLVSPHELKYELSVYLPQTGTSISS